MGPRRCWIQFSLAALIAPAAPVFAQDTDGDGRPDAFDNCIEVANPTQCDTDLDGFGNHCDGDFNQDGRVNAVDAVDHLVPEISSPSGDVTSMDMDCDGDVDINDYVSNEFDAQYTQGAPGPSADLSVTMVKIPETVNGKSYFIMGWVKDEATWGSGGAPCGPLGNNEDLAHRVQIPSFEISGTEITRAEWREVMGTEAFDSQTDCGQCPARVNWWSAAAFANQLSAEKGLPSCYELLSCNGGDPGADPASGGLKCSGLTVTAVNGDPYECTGYRIPTEAEWSKAVQGDDPLTVGAFTYAGNPLPSDASDYCDGFQDLALTIPLYDTLGNPTGKTLEDIAWWRSSTGHRLYVPPEYGNPNIPAAQAVRLKDPVHFTYTPIYDMLANAAEWGFEERLLSWADDPRHNTCSEIPTPQGCGSEEVTTNPYGPHVTGHRGRLDRGADIQFYPASDVRNTYRSELSPDDRRIGFRVVRTLTCSPFLVQLV